MRDNELAQRDELIEHLLQRVQALEEQLGKDSHNSHWPSSSDRFVCQPKSLRKKSEKKPGGQVGHPGKTLEFSSAPDAVIVHAVERCQHCQQDLTALAAEVMERRQVVDLPHSRLLVAEHQVEHKRCPHCQVVSVASFPKQARAPIQYGASIGAMAVYSEDQSLWWAAKLKELVLDMREETEQARAQGKHWLHPLEVVAWQACFLALLDEGDQAHPRATAPPGHRGRVKQRDARNLLDRLRQDQQSVWAFLEDLRVPFDNNQAERDLRMVKIQQKVSGCFRTETYASAFARIRGYLSTLRKQGLPLLSVLQATWHNLPVLPSFQ